MAARLDRRHFLAVSTAAGASLALASRGQAATWKTTLRKSLVGNPTNDVLRQWKEAGFEGYQTTDWNAPPQKIAEARKAADSLGMKIHSVLFGWGNMNGGDAAMAESVAKMETALQAAKAYGAGDVLLVPCKIDGMPIPDPWDLDICFDETTGHLKQVVAGDNSKYRKYIEAHDHAVDTSREGVKRLIPMAEKTGVVIALENVWNNLWFKPGLFANFIASFHSPWVKCLFDIGNHVKFAPSQEWIRALGGSIVSCHVKDFKLGPEGRGGGWEGFCNIRDGSVDWPAVRKALDDIGYNGWMAIEGGSLPPAELSRRLDLILTGK
jgi:L-ribulose-5-phosphate 3-epimerase